MPSARIVTVRHKGKLHSAENLFEAGANGLHDPMKGRRSSSALTGFDQRNGITIEIR